MNMSADEEKSEDTGNDNRQGTRTRREESKREEERSAYRALT
jgi:hypothetical protein